MPKRDTTVTARVQGQFLAAEREIQIVSRTIKEMKVTIPPQWAQDSRLSWNGLALEKIEAPGAMSADRREGVLACREMPVTPTRRTVVRRCGWAQRATKR